MNVVQGKPQIFSREEARKIYGLGPEEELIFETNIGGPEAKAQILKGMFVDSLVEAVRSHGKVTVTQAKDIQSGQIILDRLAVIGSKKT